MQKEKVSMARLYGLREIYNCVADAYKAYCQKQQDWNDTFRAIEEQDTLGLYNLQHTGRFPKSDGEYLLMKAIQTDNPDVYQRVLRYSGLSDADKPLVIDIPPFHRGSPLACAISMRSGRIAYSMLSDPDVDLDTTFDVNPNALFTLGMVPSLTPAVYLDKEPWDITELARTRGLNNLVTLIESKREERRRVPLSDSPVPNPS